ncbi:MAG: hypothetical protein HETSPECPRED_007272 [Heterodermia speciosa]|uniref:Major facilitator superfamily (MFS) profile domain-containing protein n=1 Tax=Heterodermia speciosa TaxID=116794 RepID=A0A8H3IRP3_9LECA|nr:MAG: hypothetical protein HETSPECPRED_007272 [Heterodermia speciosa]
MHIYRLNALQVGLTYLPYGVGCGLASYATGEIIDRDYKKTAISQGITIDRVRGDDISKFPIERARLRSIWYFIAISTTCTISYGWALHSSTHLAVPLILQFLCGLTVTGTFNVCNTLIVDIHPDCPATASAAVSVVRCSIAAIGVSVLQYLLDSLGPGWTFTVLGALCIATVPLLLCVRSWGLQWRTGSEEREFGRQSG